MISIKLPLLGFILFATPSFSQNESFAPSPPSWYIYNPTFYTLIDKNGTHKSGSISLFRSGRRIFTSYKTYNHISCFHAPEEPDTLLKDGWMSCQENPDAPEGERELSPDVYERLNGGWLISKLIT